MSQPMEMTSMLKYLTAALVALLTINAVQAQPFELPITHEVVQPGRDKRQYGIFVWAVSALYTDECMSDNDPMKTRSINRLRKHAESFSDEEIDRSIDNAIAEFKRLGPAEFCRINTRI
jgi:hypothetical protein